MDGMTWSSPGEMGFAPTEIENLLSQHDAVTECAVVGHYDNAGLLKPRAFVCLREGEEQSDALLADLLKLCAKNLDAHKRPRWLEFLDDLPRTATGKLQRFRLREQ